MVKNTIFNSKFYIIIIIAIIILSLIFFNIDEVDKNDIVQSNCSLYQSNSCSIGCMEFQNQFEKYEKLNNSQKDSMINDIRLIATRCQLECLNNK